MNTLGHLTRGIQVKIWSFHLLFFFHWGPGKGLEGQAASPLASSSSFSSSHILIFLLKGAPVLWVFFFLSRLLFFSTWHWSLDFPGLSWFLLKDSHSRNTTHIYIHINVFLFFCFLAPTGFYGAIWLNYFWHFAHQNVQSFKGIEMTVNLPPPEQMGFSFQSCCLGNKWVSLNIHLP